MKKYYYVKTWDYGSPTEIKKEYITEKNLIPTSIVDEEGDEVVSTTATVIKEKVNGVWETRKAQIILPFLRWNGVAVIKSKFRGRKSDNLPEGWRLYLPKA